MSRFFVLENEIANHESFALHPAGSIVMTYQRACIAKRPPSKALRALELCLCLLSAGFTKVARAQWIAPGLGPVQSPFSARSADGFRESNPPKESSRSFRLFDSQRVERAFDLRLGPLFYRQTGGSDDFARGTGQLDVGAAIVSRVGHLYLVGLQKMAFRAFDSKSFALSLLSSNLNVGLQVGPFEPEAGIGLGLLTVDVFRGDYSAELFSPSVNAGVGVHLGQIRLDIAAQSEYLWRWFGPDVLVRGIFLGLRIATPRPPAPFSGEPAK